MATTTNGNSGSELTRPSSNGPAGRDRYQILVKSCLDGAWSDWFEGLSILPDWQHDQTAIVGCLPDQEALYGLLNKVRDLGLVLIGVTCLDGASDTPSTS